MPKFWSFIGNDQYNVGCTGQTVYLYNKQGEELAKFKDLIYAYTVSISPKGDCFAVKSTDGRLAVYSLDPPALIKKFRYSKFTAAQDDNFCFSADGSEFYNIERHNGCETALSIYDTSDFSLKRRILDSDKSMVLSYIENEKETNTFYLLGFFRGKNGVAEKFFIGKLNGSELSDIEYISPTEYSFFSNYLDLRFMGFTQLAYEWSYEDVDLDKMKAEDLSLSKIWAEYRDQ